MNAGRLARLVRQSIGRSWRDFLFSSVGIIIGIGTLLFFTALGQGIKRTVLEEVFVVRQLEVVPRAYSMFGSNAALDDAMVERLKKIPGVKGVYPKMKARFPAGGAGGKEFLGRDLHVELVADGIPDALVTSEEVSAPFAFRDWEAPVSCQADSACPDGHACDGAKGQCVARSCSPRQQGACGAQAYCHHTGVCKMPIPVVISPQLIELYNGTIKKALQGKSNMITALSNPKMLIGVQIDGTMGRSFFIGSASRGRPERHKLRLVGFSKRAISLGITMPLGYVKRMNRKFAADQRDAAQYDSVLVETHSNDVIPHVARAVTEGHGLALSERYQQAERAGLLILIITLVFNLISVIILGIAAVNIMHTFLMIVMERRKELGLLRALGATKGQLRVLVLAEATVLGAGGGAAGVLAGWAAMRGVDLLFSRQVQDFPFKPETLFLVEGWMVALGFGVALLFCWLGALWPAWRASNVDPASALTGH